MLILAGEVVLADGPANAVEGVERLALGMKRLALPTLEASRSPDRFDLVDLVRFGDRRKANDLPRLLAEHVTDEVVFV